MGRALKGPLWMVGRKYVYFLDQEQQIKAKKLGSGQNKTNSGWAKKAAHFDCHSPVQQEGPKGQLGLCQAQRSSSC